MTRRPYRTAEFDHTAEYWSTIIPTWYTSYSFGYMLTAVKNYFDILCRNETSYLFGHMVKFVCSVFYLFSRLVNNLAVSSIIRPSGFLSIWASGFGCMYKFTFNSLVLYVWYNQVIIHFTWASSALWWQESKNLFLKFCDIVHYWSSLDCNIWHSFCLFFYSRVCYKHMQQTPADISNYIENSKFIDSIQ